MDNDFEIVMVDGKVLIYGGVDIHVDDADKTVHINTLVNSKLLAANAFRAGFDAGVRRAMKVANIRPLVAMGS